MWFVTRKARELSTGAQAVGFLGDGSLHVPFVDTGTGIPNQRQVLTTGASLSVTRQVLANSQGLNVEGRSLGGVNTLGLIQNPTSNALSNYSGITS